MCVEYPTYQSESFTCRKCGWQGKGDELVNGEFSEEHSICDLECPECFELVAFWQVPLTKENIE